MIRVRVPFFQFPFQFRLDHASRRLNAPPIRVRVRVRVRVRFRVRFRVRLRVRLRVRFRVRFFATGPPAP